MAKVKANVLTELGYTKLLRDLKGFITAGKKRAERAAGQELIRTYWEVGKRIHKEKLTENAGYGDAIFTSLAEDLSTDSVTLRRSVDFFRLYPNINSQSNYLTWSHYKELVTIKHLDERTWYEHKASESEWTRDALVAAMRREAYSEGDAVQEKSRVPRLKRPSDASFTYVIEAKRVIDGDTLIGMIDLGFEVHKSQRFRLADVDAESRKTKIGYKAYEYVRDQLAQASSVVIKSSRGSLDIHGRYIADVFYSFRSLKKKSVFETGRYLNQELLSRGLAKRL